MRIILSFLIAVSAFASDAPRPLTAEEQLTAARAQISVLQTELANAQAQNQALRAEIQANQAASKYEADLAKLRTEHATNAQCQLKTDQTWACPAKPDK